MMLQSLLVCCLIGLGLADNTLYFVPHNQQAPSPQNFSCPDQTQCPVGNTCCQVADNSQFGCCPYKNAVCCSDGIHCCQQGTTCHPQGRGCIHGDGSRLHVGPIGTKPEVVDSVLCPDKEGMCPNGHTCCEGSNHQYGCCPYNEASCCADKKHCCPKGLKCDLSGGGCVKEGQGHFLSLFKHPLTKTNPAHYEGKNIICGNGSQECPDGSTCCKLTSGQYGCCPLLMAVCCADMIHCCPSGYTCDPSSGTCNKGDVSVPWVEKKASTEKKVEDIQCDASHECPDNNTCCMMADNQWGCCPMPKAVCCSDKAHCCPKGTTCDMPHGQCKRQDGVNIPWLAKRPAVRKELESIQCDSSHECLDGQTCCKLTSGGWGCCPFPQAVCCADMIHCCPSGYTCDPSSGTCNKGDVSVPWVEKKASIEKKVEDIQCDATHECPDNNTCCMMADNQWGCCPMPKAVCCSDKAHCCPKGTTCDMPHGQCKRQDGVNIPWLAKRPAVKKELENIQCDSSHECLDGQTCCKLTSGGWGCCPLSQAVCCSDHVHCCPQGTTCDVTQGKCNRQDGLSLTWFKKTQAIRKKVEMVKCDETHECPDGNTCCMSSAGWQCCPLPKAVCCSDHVHCCPSGTTCDVAQGKCQKRDGSSDEWVKKTLLVKNDPNIDIIISDSLADGFKNRPHKFVHKMEAGSVVCPGGQTECPDGSTCCKLVSGSYGCCPFPKAVCCSDHAHCCPTGMTCDVSNGTCNTASISFTWTDKKPSLARKIQNKEKIALLPEANSNGITLKSDKVIGSVQCNSQGASCPDNQTCCPIANGQFGCCPMPKGVCCSDHIHCCPQHSTCSMTLKKCVVRDSLEVIDWLERRPGKPVGSLEHTVTVTLPNVTAVMCPDGRSECPDGSTCCLQTSGSYGCCPLPDAVCCSDGIHCCPEGFVCNLTAMDCQNVKGGIAMTFIHKHPAQAVCCSDGSHCCPHGTTCDVASGTCDSLDGVTVQWLEKIKAVSKSVESVQCDSGHYCPDGNTCCKLASGSWGCCPIPNAVCCSDQTHCCPHGTTCGTKTCYRGDGVMFTWLKRRPAIKKNHFGVFTCNGSRKQCNDGQTCCKTAAGYIGCCDYTNGVCCSDGTHCCPSGSSCDVESGHCVNSGMTTSWSLIQQGVDESNIPCGSSTCPDSSTCCKLSSGGFGCCPLPNAVCCSDGVHCCPSGTTCDTTAGTCNTQDGYSVPWSKKTVGLHKKVENVICDSTHECPDGNTCCKLASGDWGCCPMPQAVCCSDHTHCCPQGRTCDTGSGTCNSRDGISVPWLKKTAALRRKVENVICDSTHECPDGNTCCKMASGDWGCCPMPQAVCCSDHIHCCPHGRTCDTGSGTCNSQDGISVPWLKKTAALRRKVENVICDSTHECPDGNTCCKMASGDWGCCPMPQAVCCSDHTHCCPQGRTCDTGSGTCNSQDGISVPWLKKTAALRRKVENVICDSTHECPDGNTCCKMASGDWGCCPMPQAVCCSDHTHCCPQGRTCDTGSGTCNSQDGISVPWLKKTAALRRKVENVICDSTHECPDGNTCCKMASGDWGCCPMPQAVCCSDHTHCCPQGRTCDTGSGTCNSQDGISVPWLKKTAALRRKVENVICDSTHECPDGNTCCKMASGDWGCCPMPQAVCCSDHTHCCPQGRTCDTGSGTCNSQDGISVPWLKKTAALRRKVENVICDSTHECPDGNTCCKMASGDWGCCPMPQAVCCSDHTHCCPQGRTCDTGSGTCNSQDGISVPWLKKTAALRRKVENVICDSTHECPDGNTCCKMASGDWGCCPMPQAVCCSDHTHCCPQGRTCDTGSGTCNSQDGISVPWLKKTAALRRKVENVICDSTHECPDGNTCCKMASGDWGCCPMPQAVCCSDHTHCCPQGRTCDTGSGTCNSQDGISVPWLKKTAALRRKVENVICDSTHECPDGNTCCKMASGDWGCCPMPQAVCCSDHIHCCPHGRTCDTGSGTCNSQDGISVPWLKKTAALRRKVENVICDSTHECPDGNTCCKLASGDWGCCPMPQAVCCSDHTHCCPQGRTCDTGSGTCNSQDGISVPWLKKTAALRRKVENVICDSTHECPDGNTCCKMASGDWGCCPMPQAVCCSDHIHCCPKGRTCDTGSGTCRSQGGISVPWLKKTAALRRKVENVICDSTHECPDGNMCCKLASGGWGCCPMPQAVCCSDHTHCCPQGRTCDTGSGTCNSQDGISVPWLKKTAALRRKVENVICDSTHECPDGNTCCKLASGDWGCCPMPQAGNLEMVKCDETHECPTGNTCCRTSTGWGCCPLPEAVCCSDGIHCCPHGTTCDVAQGKCNRQDGLSLTWLKKTQASSKKVEMVKCDETHECPTGNTCCRTSTGWGCCPLPEAVCCSDRVHCCPHGTTCDVASGKCNRQDGLSLTWFKKTQAISKKVEMVNCDDGSQCPDGNSCCKMPSGSFGCCPVPKAVCCSDNFHCCPEDTTCSLIAGRCSRNNGSSTQWLEKTAAVRRETIVQCDGTIECEDGTRCCKTNMGWGCCPLQNGVCCSDGLNCCPEGTTCDVVQGRCSREDGSITQWLQTIKHDSKKVEMVKCDETHECPTGNTCCRTSTGWGCCPLPEAVCCSDGIHCCPHGTTCDVAQGKCNRQDGLSLTWFKKTQAISKKVEMVKCDETHECPTGNTCCRTNTGWGCCPLPEAVCCSDGIHCCPHGTTCDVAQGKCNRQDGLSLTWFKKTQASSKKVEIVKCDETHECPTGSTCCKTSAGWGCCPLPEAVCCTDGIHCCPHGTTCDVAQGKCNRQDGLSLTWFKKTQASSKKVEMVKCDETHECPTGNTCCRTNTGWGCCPLPEAVCCSDGVHCCPHGTTCDVAQGKCNRQDGLSLTWFKKTKAISKNVEMVKCDETHECPTGNTCCRTSTGWGCCPLPEAVCCSDGIHCCPHGTTCDVASGKCNRQDGLSLTWFKKTQAISKKVEMVKCDETHECPTGNTCCRTNTGWGCCPLPEAVCCSDGVHCCPHGTTCDVAQGKCNRQDGSSLPWLKKNLANSQKKEPVSVKTVGDITCKDNSKCPDDSTCCELASGSYGCCPIGNALCCPDKIHCCPHGYSCDTATGTCTKGGLRIPFL